MRAIDSKVPTSYAAARYALGGRDHKRISANTRLDRRSEHSISVVLYSTPIVTFWADGSIVLHSNGWRTVTTKSRMNAALVGVGARVYQDKHEWRVRLAGHSDHDYFDGYTIHS